MPYQYYIDNHKIEIKTEYIYMKLEILPTTVIGELLHHYPFVQDFLIKLSPLYSRMTNPIVFKTMKNIATLQMISRVGGFEVNHFIRLIKQEIKDRGEE